MKNSLLDHLQSVFSPSAIDDLARTLNENQAAIRKAVDGLIPSLTSAIAGRTETANGASAVYNSVTNTPFETDPSIQQVVELPQNRQSAAESGNAVLKDLYGNQVPRFHEAVSQYSGVGLGAGITLTGLVTSVLMGYLHQRVMSGTLTEAQLAAFLLPEAGAAHTAVPAALAGILGGLVGPAIVGGAPVAAPVAAKSAGLPWLWWLLIGLALLLLFWFLTRSCSRDEAGVNTSALSPVDSLATDAYGNSIPADPSVSNLPDSLMALVPVDTLATDANGNDMADRVGTPSTGAGAGTMPKVRIAVNVPGGRKLLLTDSSFNFQLARYLATSSSGDKPNRVFFFDDLRFDFDKSTLRPGAEQEVANLIEIMKAYPTLNIKIVGHTDAVGPASVNQPLSEARAESVRDALVKGGISANRLSVRKRGETEPIATNETPQGRQRNRRIDIIVTKI